MHMHAQMLTQNCTNTIHKEEEEEEEAAAHRGYLSSQVASTFSLLKMIQSPHFLPPGIPDTQQSRQTLPEDSSQ